MKEAIKWTLNRMPKSEDKQLPVMSLSNVAKARFFHSSFPQYSITPLAELDGMAKYLGLAGLYVKNEAHRFGLNAFKVLGGSFAMGRYIAKEMGRDVSEMTYDYLTSETFRREFGQATFFTATDGNHGRGVAWAANKLGQKAVVHMPKGSSQPRFDNIAKEGAQVTIEELNYDDCVRLAAAEAERTEHGVIVQDTAWDGYEEIPSWIMQGYGTMASESAEQLRQVGVNRLLHQPLPQRSPQVHRHGGHGRGLPLPGRPGRGRQAPGGNRRPPDHHGGPCLRRAQHHLLGHPAQPRLRLRLLPRLGQRPGNADAGGAREGRPHGDLRRERRSGHGPAGGADGGRLVRRAAGGHRPGPVQPGADVLHRGKHGPAEVPEGDLGRGVRHGLTPLSPN